jgi:hypothetical protein
MRAAFGRGFLIGGGGAVGAAKKITQRVGMNSRQAHEDPFVIEVVVGGVVGGGVGGDHFVAFFKTCADDESFAVFFEAGEERLADFECGRAVGLGFLDGVEGKREFPNGLEGDGHIC